MRLPPIDSLQQLVEEVDYVASTKNVKDSNNLAADSSRMADDNEALITQRENEPPSANEILPSDDVTRALKDHDVNEEEITI